MKTLRTLLSAVAIGLLGFAAGPARATLVDVGFDPVGMSGDVLIDVAQECLNLDPGTYAPPPEGCTFDFQSVTFVSGPLTGTWFSTTNPMDVGSFQIPGATGNNLFGNVVTNTDVFLESSVILLSPVLIDQPTCDPRMSFGSGGEFNLGTLTLTTCDQLVATASVISVSVVPEPGTLALLLGAIGAGWLTRRGTRKR